MNIRFLAASGLCFAALGWAASAAAQGDSELVLCAQIRDDAERLECFDRVARKQSRELETGRPAAPAPESAPVPPPAPAASPQSVSPTPAAPPAATPPVDTQPPEAAPSAEDRFGAEQTRREPPEELTEIRSRIVGYFDGFTGGTEVTLANGQVWQQMDAARLPVQKRDPEVVIEKGYFGGYRLTVDGLNRSIRVKRIE